MAKNELLKVRKLYYSIIFTTLRSANDQAIAQALNSKVYCDTHKSAILKCQADSDLDALLTSNPKDAVVHLVPMSTITTDRLKIYLDRFKGSYNKIVGFRPTGWT